MSDTTPWINDDGGLVAGIYYDCPEPVYRKLPALNWSRAKVAVLKSLAAAKRAADDAAKGISTDTAGRALNRLVHALTLDPNAVKSEFCLSEYDAFRSKDAKAYKAALQAEGVTPVGPKAWGDAESASAIIRRHKGAAAMLAKSHGEVVAIALLPVRLTDGRWVDVWVKCKADLLWMTPQGFYLGDLKAASDTDPDAFIRTEASKLGYPAQLDLYSTIVRLAMIQSGTAEDDPRATPLRPYWIAQHEKTSRACVIPCVTQPELDDGLAEDEPSQMQLCGRALWQEALSLYVTAERSGDWPQRHDETMSHAPRSWPQYAPGMGLSTWDEQEAESLGGDDQ